MSAAHVLACELRLRIPAAQSLKDKRRVVRSVLDRAGRSSGVGAAEIAANDDRQLACLGFVAIGGSPGQVSEMIDGVERLCWSQPDVEVLDATRTWTEFDR